MFVDNSTGLVRASRKALLSPTDPDTSLDLNPLTGTTVDAVVGDDVNLDGGDESDGDGSGAVGDMPPFPMSPPRAWNKEYYKWVYYHTTIMLFYL